MVKGTTIVTLDFDDYDDDVFDEEAEKSRASHLTESTIDVNTGEKVACQLEKGVSTGKFFFVFVLFDLNFEFLFFLFYSLFSFLCRGIFP